MVMCMVGLPRSIIKKYGVTKKAWAVFRGSSGQVHTHRARRRMRASGGMVRHRRGRRHSGGSSGIMSYVKPLVVGTLAGIVAPRIPFLNTLPFYKGIAGAAASYLMGGKTLPKMATAAIGGEFVAPIAGTAINNATGMRIY